FRFQAIYSSKLFRHMLNPETNEVNLPDDETGKSIQEKRLEFAYLMILKKYHTLHAPDSIFSIHPYIDSVTGLKKYFGLTIDRRFTDVKPVNELPPLPPDLVNKRTNRLMPLAELQKVLPLDKFIFEGLNIVRISDVTEQEVISRIKNTLLETNAFTDESVYEELESHVQSLMGLKDIKIGITPFFKINGHYVYSDLHNSNSLLYKEFRSIEDKVALNQSCITLFEDTDRSIVFEVLNEEEIKKSKYLELYHTQGVRSLIVSPLKHDDELLGVLEVVSEHPGKLKHTHISRIETAIHLFTLALKKSAESLDTQIDKVIKKQFTAVQPAVEWKFTEVALNYIVAKHKHGAAHEDVKMERIAFEEVYPLYAAIDIRNSSVERSHSIQLDIIDQLNMARDIIKKAQAAMDFPLLQEIEFKIDKHISSASDSLLSDEEILIYDFLQNQVVSIFNHLKSTVPSIRKDLEAYFGALDPQMNMIYHHRKEYEQSISKINNNVAHFIDKEQSAAQQVFPHYFERYVTDGVEFNIYIGQSLTPRRKFDELYLRNMKMWQLTVMAKAARLTHQMEKELSHPLRTTQLILAHNIPISISFRVDERKFDVDGDYNIRYEIMKKRIDKVRIKETNERLTQPGKLAVVYAQLKEADEYKEYIEFLQNQKLLKAGVEQHDLEELQGVLGLKALRVEVNFDDLDKVDDTIALSTLTSQQLIGK
ncbi:MAG: hypothetical protein M3O67_09820, partial [Bacteroidota bacterium]|nr:hypothetical protein [Bacteroidota bacterium]